jgi:tetratricopeptide (TPR) repeat protein
MHHVHFRKAIPEFQRANAEFQKLFGSNSFSLTNYNLGLCHEKLGEQEQAIKHYEKSILNLPSAEAFNALAHAHHASFQNSKNKKELEIADNYYRKALQAKPEYSIAVFNLGMLQLERGEWAAAIENFQGCSASIRSCKYGLIKAYYGSNSSALALPIIDSL